MKTVHRLSLIFLKYAPVFAAVIMWVHVVCLIHGLTLFVAQNLIGLPIIPCVTCCIWSKAFGFCKMHRYFICYVCAMTYCINLHSLWNFGILLNPLRYIMLILGLILIIQLIISCKKHKCDGQIKNN